MRRALGDLAVQIDISQFPPELRPYPGQAEEAFESLPRLDPPLSRTIIEDRENRI